jgi:tetratricopeptide (TPR) repeat protein
MERAIALNPAYSTVHQWYGEHLTKMGRGEEGEAHMRRAIALDPLSLVAQSDLGIVLMLNRRYPESIAQFEHVRRLDPAFPLPLLLLHRVHMIAGNAAAAAEAARRWAEITGMGDPAELMLLARATRDTALRNEARTVLARWEREPAPRWPDIAMYFLLLGDRDDALRALELGLHARTPMMAQLKVAPWLDRVRDDPRFLAVLQRMDLQADPHHDESSSSPQGACIVRYGIETETLYEDGVRVADGSTRWDAFWARWPEMAEARDHWLVWTSPLCTDIQYDRFLEERGLES